MSRAPAAADVFLAIADPTRRRILDLLGNRERAVLDLLAHFDISQPALSQHLKVLRDAGLVVPRKLGRQRLYRVDPEPLRAVADWMAAYWRFWPKKLSALGKYLEKAP